MKYIITERQYQLLIEDFDVSEKSDVYSFVCLKHETKWRPPKIYFNSTKIVSKSDEPTNVIEFVNPQGQNFKFDNIFIKFSRNDDAFITVENFLKFYSLSDLEEGKKLCQSNKLESDSEMSSQIRRALKIAFNKYWHEEESGIDGFTAGLRGIYTIGEKTNDEETNDDETWSIMNYFDTKPEIQRMIKTKYQQENPDNLEFVDWLVDVFSNDTFFTQKLVDRQWESIKSGIMTEKKIIKDLKTMFPNSEIKTYPPGKKMDRYQGVDVTIDGINFQIKPLSSYVKTKEGYLVYTYGMKSNYQYKKYLDYILYYKNNEMLIFPKKPYTFKSSSQVLHPTEPIDVNTILE